MSATYKSLRSTTSELIHFIKAKHEVRGWSECFKAPVAAQPLGQDRRRQAAHGLLTRKLSKKIFYITYNSLFRINENREPIAVQRSQAVETAWGVTVTALVPYRLIPYWFLVVFDPVP